MLNRASLIAFFTAMLVTLLCLQTCSSHVQAADSFDLSNASIPKDKILLGGPGKDGIPSIDTPQFSQARTILWLDEDEHVLSLTIGRETRAYPISILNWHEIVNDQIGGYSVVITYCPLCGSGMAFRAKAPGHHHMSFGVSGLLYNSDLLLYDRQTHSLWSQIKGESVSGELLGAELEQLPLQQMSWRAWRKQYPKGKVLNRDTGFLRDYRKSPYGRYDESAVVYFPVDFYSHAYHPKERVLGVKLDGKFKAYPFAELGKYGGSKLRDTFNGQELIIHYDALSRSGRITQADGKTELPSVNLFWFAWYAFYPDTEIFRSP